MHIILLEAKSTVEYLQFFFANILYDLMAILANSQELQQVDLGNNLPNFMYTRIIRNTDA